MGSTRQPGRGSGRFPTTHWSLVLAAGLRDARARAALEELCRVYWYPLYSFARHKYPTRDAQDMVQGFFARFLQRNYFESLGPEKGKLRSYLRTALSNYIENDRRRDQAQRRGGDVLIVSLDDLQQGERRFVEEPSHQETPEMEFEVKWAFTVLNRVLARLENDYARAGKAAHYATLRDFLPGGNAALSYAEAAGRLDIPVSHVRVVIHRMRKKYGEVLRSEIGQTLADPQDVDQEIRDLREILSRPRSL